MAHWDYFGTERKDKFERMLEPEMLADDLADYQKKFGKEFGVKELLLLHDIKAKALIAQAINDVPEFLLDQVGKARSDSSFHSITRELEVISGAIEKFVEDI